MWKSFRFMALIWVLAISPVAALDHPLCDEPSVLSTVRFQNGGAEGLKAPDGKPKEILDIAETAFGPPPPSANQFANAVTYITKSRFCEARIVYDTGVEDRVFWQIDHVKDGAREYVQTQSCALTRDITEDQCRYRRPPSEQDKQAQQEQLAKCGEFFDAARMPDASEADKKVAELEYEVRAAFACASQSNKPMACKHYRRLVEGMASGAPVLKEQQGVDFAEVLKNASCD